MTMIGTHGFALAFDTALTLHEMISTLNLRIPQWKWFEWQNDKWGDYIRGAAKAKGGAWFKILYDDEIQRWAVDVNFESPLSQAAAISEQLRTFAMSQLLPAVDAKRVTALEESY